jgi:DNA-binding NarL/FixJ family response regulator
VTPSAFRPVSAAAGEATADDGIRGTAHLLADLAAIERVTGRETSPPIELPPEELDAARRNGGCEQLGNAVRAALDTRAAPRARAIDDADVTCLVADDHPIVRAAICNVLERHGLEVVCRASDGESALDGIAETRPAVALVDVKLPAPDGLTVAREAGRRAPETAVILYTGADPMLLAGALDCGARGFILKEAPVVDLVRAVRMVAGGQLYFDPALASFLVESPAARALSFRELEVVRRLADGRTYEAIGKELFLSPETVRTQVRSLLKKLNVRNRTEAVATALREQLIA